MLCEKLERNISLDRFGEIHIRDTYYIRNLGTTNISSIPIRIPTDARGIYATDPNGLPFVDLLTDTTVNYTIVHIPPRYAFGYPLRSGEKCSFTLIYSLPTRNRIKQLEWNRFALNLSFVPSMFPIKEISNRVNLPEGSSFVSSSFHPVKVEETFQGTFIEGGYEVFNVSFKAPSISIIYEFSLFWSTFYPTLWASILGIITYSIAYLSLKPTVLKASASIKEIQDFLHCYGERLLLIDELMNLEERFEKSEVSKREYERRKSIIERNISTLDLSLKDLKEELRKIGPKFAEVVRRIDSAETQMKILSSDLNEIRRKFNLKEISREVYLELSEKYKRGLDKTRLELKKALIDLAKLK